MIGETIPRMYDFQVIELCMAKMLKIGERIPHGGGYLPQDRIHVINKRIHSSLNHKGKRMITQRIMKREYIRNRERDELGVYGRETPKQM